MLVVYGTNLLLLLSPFLVSGGEAPVCDPSESPSCGTVLLRKNKGENSTPPPPPVTLPPPCELYLAESAVRPGKLGLFTGVKRSVGEHLGEPEIMIPILDAHKNEWSPWNDMVMSADRFPQILQESFFINDVFVPGIARMASCSNKYSNFAIGNVTELQADSVGVHRVTDPTAGSFSYYQGYTYEATKTLQPGEELVMPCPADDDEQFHDAGRKVLSLKFLQEISVCLDNLSVGPSTVKGAGRGAFAKRAVKTGNVIAHSPVIHFDRSQIEMRNQELYDEDHFLPLRRDHGIRYSDKVKAKQLLLNYCYGQPDSNVLLLPYAPAVNYINNHNSRDKANAYIRWTNTHELLPGTDATYMKSQRPMELFAIPVHNDGYETLMIEFVALRNIEPGEEIFLFPGEEWEAAWQEHVDKWTASTDDSYVSAADWIKKHGDEPIRTVEEQKTSPYPETIKTACYFAGKEYDAMEATDFVYWDEKSLECLRPCRILSRKDDKGTTTFSAVVYPMDRFQEPGYCEELAEDGFTVLDLPAKAVKLMDAPYSSDVHLPIVFRHEMGLPHNFYPEAWKAADPNPEGDFIPTPLAPGTLSRIHFKDNGKIVLQNAFRLGLTSKIRETLLEYCNKMGITDIFRHLTVEDNGLVAGTETELNIQGYNWFIQRPDKKWFSNLHWLSPGDNRAHEHYLQALSVAGFDDMLQGIGEFLGLDHLVVFHVTFIAVSQSTRGYVHTDVSDTGARTFNIIIPLMKATVSPPELDIQENLEDGRIGRYPYELDVAALMGDESWHGTSAVDYRMAKEMRLAATVYIAEVTEQNVYSIMKDYTQAYPPPDDEELLLSWAGRHWKRDDPSAHLPRLSRDHILVTEATAKE